MTNDDAFGWKKKRVPEIKEELKRLGLGAHGKKAELIARLEEHLSTEPSRAEPSRVMPSQIMVDCCLCWLTRTRGHDGLIKINKILIKINKILHRPPLDLPVNARPRAERPRRAYRRR